jgi:Zn-dependent oligopeptidase
MADKTDAQKRAQKKYMEKFVEVKVRMTPEKRSQIQDHAKKLGKSTTEFINRAIDETMERDNKK